MRFLALMLLLSMPVPGRPLLSGDMPGKSFSGKLPALTPSQTFLAKRLRQDVEKLGGERNIEHVKNLNAARKWLLQEFQAMGYDVKEQVFAQHYANIEAISKHGKGPILVVGAHYDTVHGSPGANDNGSGVASLLALARYFKDRPTRHQLRFVAFTNEEPPNFLSDTMGSLVYARSLQKGKIQVKSMLALETMGYYSDQPGSQRYPPPLNLAYPDVGNFIGFVGNLESGELVKQCVGTFRKHAKFPSEGTALPGSVEGVGWSDHWSFWQIGVRAVMVTDTAPFRYPHYHRGSDTADKIDYERLARVVEGLRPVIEELAKPQ